MIIRPNWTLFTSSALIGLILGSIVSARADKALVVGVNEYPKLASGSNLEGCVNDAHNIQKSLTALGFEVTTLTDDGAAKQNILDALMKLKSVSQAGERFVFYFAGHGSIASDGSSTLLPGDASEKNEASDLTRDELYNAVMSVPARSRTMLLDSCFSGGLSRKGLGHKVKKTRYYRRAGGTNQRRTLDVAGADNNDHVAGGKEIVYFTASLANQTSGEDDFDTVRGGVFTHFLTARLEKATKQTLWNEVQKDVTGEVADYMEQTQTPKLSPTDYAARPIFEGIHDPTPEPKPDPKPEPKPDPKPTPDPKPVPQRTLWDDFNEDHTDTSFLQLAMKPSQTTLKVKQKFAFDVKIGAQDGWMVLLEKDTDGKVYLIFPADRTPKTAHVGANSLVRLPLAPGRAYAADTAGVERIKALLFTDEASAAALIAAFPAEGVEPHKMRRIVEMESEPRQSFYTFGLTFGVE